MERNKNVDICRGGATLLVVLYHVWVLCGAVPFRSNVLTAIISLGGEVGVTAFFLLSGYGIYCSLSATDMRGKISLLPFMKKRLARILPQYYFCLFMILFFMDGAYEWQTATLGDIITHLLLIHNFSPAYHGSLNGVLWTLGVIFQFYLIAIPIYYGIKRWKAAFCTGAIAATILIKVMVYRFILPNVAGGDALYFFAGRQLFTALDNFVIGMFVAHLVLNRKHTATQAKNIVGLCASLVFLLAWQMQGRQFGIHTNNLSGYVWHSVIAVALGLSIYFFSQVKFSLNNPPARCALWIAHYEYGIYLWHLLMIRNLLAKAPFMQSFIANGWYIPLYVILIGMSILTGYVNSCAVDGGVARIFGTLKEKQTQKVLQKQNNS